MKNFNEFGSARRCSYNGVLAAQGAAVAAASYAAQRGAAAVAAASYAAQGGRLK